VPLAILPWLLHATILTGLADEPRMVLLGMSVWTVCMSRLLYAAPPLAQRARLAAVAVIAGGLVMASIRTVQGPSLPPLSGDGMEAMPQGHGAGVGGIGPDRNWNPDMPKRMPGQDAPAEQHAQ